MSPADVPDRDAEHRALREALGMHALGLLPDEETVALQAHLDGCPACRAELDELAVTARALESVDPDALPDATARPTPPAWLGDALMERVHAESSAARGPGAPVVRSIDDGPRGRGRRRVLLGVAAAVLAVALAGGGLATGLALAPDGGPLETVPLAQEAPELDATAGVVPHTWGMEVRIVGSGFVEGGTYRATVLDAANRPVDAGSFLGTGGDELACSLNSSVPRDQARGFTVVDGAGNPVISARL